MTIDDRKVERILTGFQGVKDLIDSVVGDNNKQSVIGGIDGRSERTADIDVQREHQSKSRATFIEDATAGAQTRASTPSIKKRLFDSIKSRLLGGGEFACVKKSCRALFHRGYNTPAGVS